MARKSQQPVPVQAALRGAYVAVSVGAFFLAVCLSSAATSKSAAMVLVAYLPGRKPGGARRVLH